MPVKISIARLTFASAHLHLGDQSWDATQPRAVASHRLVKFDALGSADRVPARRKKVVEKDSRNCVPAIRDHPIGKTTAKPAPAIP
jgi:hypothetical protein